MKCSFCSFSSRLRHQQLVYTGGIVVQSVCCFSREYFTLQLWERPSSETSFAFELLEKRNNSGRHGSFIQGCHRLFWPGGNSFKAKLVWIWMYDTTYPGTHVHVSLLPRIMSLTMLGWPDWTLKRDFVRRRLKRYCRLSYSVPSSRFKKYQFRQNGIWQFGNYAVHLCYVFIINHWST